MSRERHRERETQRETERDTRSKNLSITCEKIKKATHIDPTVPLPGIYPKEILRTVA